MSVVNNGSVKEIEKITVVEEVDTKVTPINKLPTEDFILVCQCRVTYEECTGIRMNHRFC